jgi:hypothetical protein
MGIYDIPNLLASLLKLTLLNDPWFSIILEAICFYIKSLFNSLYVSLNSIDFIKSIFISLPVQKGPPIINIMIY